MCVFKNVDIFNVRIYKKCIFSIYCNILIILYIYIEESLV